MLHGWQFLTPDDKEAIARGALDGGVHGGPYHIELDWVDRCNARCFFCNSRDAHSGAALELERATEILGQAAAGGLRSIRLSGGGEPLLHPQAAGLLAWLAEHEIALDNLNTNGLALTDEVIAALMQVRVAELRVSLNYPDAETYAPAMGVAPRFFERVCESIARLDAARRGNPRFGKLILAFFVHRPTVGRIEEIYRLGCRLGADQIDLRELGDAGPGEAYSAADVPRIARQMEAVLREDWARGRVVSLLWSAGAGEAILNIYYKLHAEFGGPTPGMPRGVEHANRYCYLPWYSMTVMGSEAVWPCCLFVSAPGAPRTLGSLAGRRVEEVWRGAAYRGLRREMRDFMLLQARQPFFSRRVRHLTARCASHSECPLTLGLCDEEFYAATDRRLEALRRRPATRLWRAANRLGRAAIDWVKR